MTNRKVSTTLKPKRNTKSSMKTPIRDLKSKIEQRKNFKMTLKYRRNINQRKTNAKHKVSAKIRKQIIRKILILLTKEDQANESEETEEIIAKITDNTSNGEDTSNVNNSSYCPILYETLIRNQSSQADSNIDRNPVKGTGNYRREEREEMEEERGEEKEDEGEEEEKLEGFYFPNKVILANQKRTNNEKMENPIFVPKETTDLNQSIIFEERNIQLSTRGIAREHKESLISEKQQNIPTRTEEMKQLPQNEGSPGLVNGYSPLCVFERAIFF